MYDNPLFFVPRYSLRQILAVVLITSGIILSTYASSQSLNKQKAAHHIKTNEPEPDFIRWIIGITFFPTSVNLIEF